MMMFSVGSRRRLLRLAHDDPPARQALADIVVGVAVTVRASRRAPGRRRSSARHCRRSAPRSCLRAGRHGRSGGRPRPTASRRPCGGRCGSASRSAPARARSSAGCGLGDQLVVERLVEAVLLPLAMIDRDPRLGRLLIQQARQVDPLRLPVVDRRRHVEPVDPADHLVEAAEAERAPSIRGLPRRRRRSS